jgi:signal transduction histidine kinase
MKKLISFFILDETHRDIYRTQIVWDNIKRTFYFSLFVIPVILFQVLIFLRRIKSSTEADTSWLQSLVYSHTVVIFVFFIVGLTLYFFSFRKNKVNAIGKISVSIIALISLIGGGFITAIDQLQLPTINPYIITTIVAAIIFVIPPLRAIVFFLSSYIVFYYAISVTQADADLLVSNQVNGLSITAIGLCISFILWNVNMIRYQQSRKIMEQNDTLREIIAEKDKFLSIVAHDLKNPFNTIIGYSGLLKNHAISTKEEKVQKYAGLIHQSSRSLYDLLHNLFEWSRYQTRGLEFKLQNIDFSALLESSLLVFKETYEEKGINCRIESERIGEILADSFIVSSILRNLISNAIKFTEKGGEVVITAKKKKNELLVSVSDSGVGIAANQLEKIFDIKESYSSIGTNDEKGSGLGLILCKELIDKHRGKLWVESELHKGSVFYFSIPLK